MKDIERLKRGVDSWNQYVRDQRVNDPGWHANLERANLVGADLVGANLRGANLMGANLMGANLMGANLERANIEGADLEFANLENANLVGANLERANIEGADLRGANLMGANLYGARYAITQALLAGWGEVSDDLCLHLMRLDAESVPDGTKRMNAWVGGGLCPMEGHGYRRVAHFKEKREAWKPGRPWSIWRIWKRLAKEKGIKISGGDKK